MTDRAPRVLCVDDDASLLNGISRNLRRHYRVVTAIGGEEALMILRDDRDFQVIVSDMRMPGMSGAEFFAHARLIAPHAVRVLLTGQAELDAVVQAINDGRIFRYLTKPIERDALVKVVGAAVAQHRLLVFEEEQSAAAHRDVVEVAAELLWMMSPELWARTQLARQRVSAIAGALDLTRSFVAEAAIVHFDLARVSGTDGEAFGKGVAALDDARVIARDLRARKDVRGVSAEIVRAVVAYEDALDRGASEAAALYDVSAVSNPRIVGALAGAIATNVHVRAVDPDALKPGMTLATALPLRRGRIELPAGLQLNVFAVERLRAEGLDDVLEVLVAADHESDDAPVAVADGGDAFADDDDDAADEEAFA